MFDAILPAILRPIDWPSTCRGSPVSGVERTTDPSYKKATAPAKVQGKAFVTTSLALPDQVSI